MKIFTFPFFSEENEHKPKTISLKHTERLAYYLQGQIIENVPGVASILSTYLELLQGMSALHQGDTKDDRLLGPLSNSDA